MSTRRAVATEPTVVAPLNHAKVLVDERRRSGPPVSLLDYAASRLEMLCDGADMRQHSQQFVGVLRKLIAPWASHHGRTFAQRASDQWTSEISDDNTPIEFSVTLEGNRSDVRVLFEPQGTEPTLASYRAAALAFHDRLESEFGASLRRFRLISDLFAPEDMRGPFAIWNSVVFQAGKPPSFKSYFNPQARGPGRAPQLVEEALTRLGFPGAWARLCRTALSRGPWLDELKYFALDLTDDAKARIKVYVRHHAASPEELERACSAATSYEPGEAWAFASAMSGGRNILRQRATFTCNAFVEGEGERPVATTLYVPVCAYAPTDEEVRHRVASYLNEEGFDATRYRKVIERFANRPLSEGIGMQSWVAFRRYEDTARLTVYLATEARRVYEPGSIPAATGDRESFASASDATHALASYSLADHPVLTRLSSERHGMVAWLLATTILSAVIQPWEQSRGRLAGKLGNTLRRIAEETEDTIAPPMRERATQLGLDLRRRTLERSVQKSKTPARVLAAALRFLEDLVPLLARQEHEPTSNPPAPMATPSQGTTVAAIGPNTDVQRRSSEGQATLVAHQLLWSLLDEVHVVAVDPDFAEKPEDPKEVDSCVE